MTGQNERVCPPLQRAAADQRFCAFCPALPLEPSPLPAAGVAVLTRRPREAAFPLPVSGWGGVHTQAAVADYQHKQVCDGKTTVTKTARFMEGDWLANGVPGDR